MTSDKSTFVAPYYIVDQFDELQDLRYSELQYIDEYRELKMKKNDGLPVDENRLNQLEEIFKNKIVTSARWNKFQDALIGMQKFIKNEVQDYVVQKQSEMQDYVDDKTTEINTYTDTKKTEFQAEINKFDNKKTYNPTIQYYKNNFVEFNDGSGVKTYLCLKDCMGVEPTNSEYWRLLTITGAKGQDGIGIGLTFRGAYNSEVVYRKDEGVQFGGVLFASLIDNNVGNKPDLTQDTPYWAKALDVTVTNTELKGVRTLASQTSNVNFMTGKISVFNPDTDTLEVRKNTTVLIEGIHYSINPNNQSIDNLQGLWDGTIIPITFEFIVGRNQINNLVFSDGNSIQDGTISKNKLNVDLQNEIDNKAGQLELDNLAGEGRTTETIKDNADKIGILSQDIGDKIQLKTEYKDNTVGAINEVKQEVTAHKAENVTVHGVARGRGSFAGDYNEVTIPHGLEHLPVAAYATPTINPEGTLGELWIRVDETNLYIGNSGSFTGEMTWVAIL